MLSAPPSAISFSAGGRRSPLQRCAQGIWALFERQRICGPTLRTPLDSLERNGVWRGQHARITDVWNPKVEMVIYNSSSLAACA